MGIWCYFGWDFSRLVGKKLGWLVYCELKDTSVFFSSDCSFIDSPPDGSLPSCHFPQLLMFLYVTTISGTWNIHVHPKSRPFSPVSVNPIAAHIQLSMLSVCLVKLYFRRKAASCQDPEAVYCVAPHSLQILLYRRRKQHWNTKKKCFIAVSCLMLPSAALIGKREHQM